MYGVGAYKYPYQIYSEPQLPTANFRLKPPGLSGCSSCGGIGTDESKDISFILGVAAVGLVISLLILK